MMLRIAWLAGQHYAAEALRAMRQSCHAKCWFSLAVFVGGLFILMAAW